MESNKKEEKPSDGKYIELNFFFLKPRYNCGWINIQN